MLGTMLRKIYGIWFYIVFVSIFLLFYPVFYVLLKRSAWHPAANRLRKIWAGLVFIGIGCPWRIKQVEALDPNGTYVFAPNHSSNLDIPLFALTWQSFRYRFMAKKEWAEVPVFGIFFRTIDIPVDRENPRSAGRSLLAAAEALKQGYSMVIFPEGTMCADGPLTEEFKNGPFKLAIRQGVPIVPITFIDNWRLYPRAGKRGGRPGLARVVIHAPIPTKDLTAADEEMLKARVQNIVDGPLRDTWQSNSALAGASS